MKKSKALSMTLFAVSLVAALGTTSLHAHDRQGQPLRAMLKQLDLTEQQRHNVRLNMQKTRLEAKIYRQDMRSIKEQLNAVIRSAQWDESLASQLIQQKQNIHAKVALTRASSKHTLWNTLNDEQQQQLDELTQERKGKRTRPSPMRRFGPLNLSEQQKTDVEALIETQIQLRQSMKSEMTAYKQSQRALIKSDEFDQGAWLASFNQMQQNQLNIAIAGAHTRHKIWNLLDEQQQAKLTKMEKKRAKRAQKRRQRHQQA